MSPIITLVHIVSAGFRLTGNERHSDDLPCAHASSAAKWPMRLPSYSAAGVSGDITCWAQSRDDVEAVVLVGSFARGGAGMASDIDFVILTP
jgi:Nucleotidyltransferase domain